MCIRDRETLCFSEARKLLTPLEYLQIKRRHKGPRKFSVQRVIAMDEHTEVEVQSHETDPNMLRVIWSGMVMQCAAESESLCIEWMEHIRGAPQKRADMLEEARRMEAAVEEELCKQLSNEQSLRMTC
eukprot:TRINITY_DN36045_c0_g1_i1.p1 TRINITY_DN36045_c0_g1~~TRINITY_DN36045_c0_g1_i1.p1  ORF type:complete len:128 (+),score=52.44 TRINITY_DN36045_c0_g1_i1:170-553(+)